MKNISISLISILLLGGCGFDKKDLNDIVLLDENQKVIYSDEGDYDLSEYLFPDKNQTYIYQTLKYRDNQGGRRYDNQPFRVNDNEEVVYSLYDTTHIKEGIDINYTVENYSIKKIELVNDFYDIRDYRRFVDINDTYYSYEHVDNATTLYQIGWVTCKIEEHKSSKEILNKVYNDVLTLTCQSESAQGVRGEFSEKKTFTSRLYFAKHIGKIGAIGEECNTKRYNSIYKSCMKTVKQLKEIKK
jgi:hypothetical protein